MKYKCLSKEEDRRYMDDFARKTDYACVSLKGEDMLYHLKGAFENKKFLGLRPHNFIKPTYESEIAEMEYEKEGLNFFIPKEIVDVAGSVILWFEKDYEI